MEILQEVLELLQQISREREVVIPLLLRQEIYTGYDDIHIDFLIFMHKYSLFDPKLP